MKGLTFTFIGLGVMAAVVAILVFGLYNAGSDAMMHTATSGMIIP